MEIWILVGIGVAVVFVLTRNKPGPTHREPIKRDAPAVVAPPPPPQSDDERFAEQAAAVLEKWAATHESIDAHHDAQLEPMRDKVAKARALVNESGVGEAACDILRIMWHWPSWYEGDTRDKMPLPIAGLEGGGEPSGRDSGKWLACDWQGSRIRLQLHTSNSKLSLYVDNVEVMILDVYQQPMWEYDRFAIFGVSGLRAGPWMTQINDLAGQLRIAEAKRRRDYERSLYEDKARNIELD
jgi:hypothetical protein